MTNHVETIRTYFDLCERKHYRAVANRLIGDGYTWIDHTTDVVATTPQELEAALVEDLQWSDQKFVIKQAIETTDGAVVVQATVTQTLTGEWRSIKGKGQQVERSVTSSASIPKVGSLARKMYEDALSIMRQLRVVSV
jgi:hypothetical protein